MNAMSLKKYITSIQQALNALLLRALRYRQVANLILVDSVWRFRWAVIRFMFVSGISLAFMAGALGLLLEYGRLLESNDSIELIGITLEPGTSYAVLIIVMCCGGILFLCSSFMQLYAEKGFNDLGRQYGVFCAERVVSKLSSFLHTQYAFKEQPELEDIRKLTVGGSQICARVLVGILGTMPALLGFFVYSIFLVYLDITITLIIFLVMFLSSFFFYILSVQAAALMRNRTNRKLMLANDYSTLIEYIKYATSPVERGHPTVDKAIKNGGFNNYFTEFFKARGVASYSAHVSTVTQAIVIIIIGMVKGGDIISSGTGYGDLAIYLVSGRLAMSSFLAVTRSLVMINRFYPTITHYFQTIAKFEESASFTSIANYTAGSPLTLTSHSFNHSETDSAQDLSPGSCIALISSKAIDRFDLPAILSRLHYETNDEHNMHLPMSGCWVIPASSIQAPVSFCEATGLAVETDIDHLRQKLTNLGLSKTDVSSIPDILGSVMKSDTWQHLSAEAFSASHIISASQSECPLVIITSETLDIFSKSVSQNIFRNCLSQKIVLINHLPKSTSDTGNYNEEFALLFDGEKLNSHLSIEDVHANEALIQEMLARKKGGKKPDLAPDDDEEI
jgi:hypothetical protein